MLPVTTFQTEIQGKQFTFAVQEPGVCCVKGFKGSILLTGFVVGLGFFGFFFCSVVYFLFIFQDKSSLWTSCSPHHYVAGLEQFLPPLLKCWDVHHCTLF